MESDLSPLIAYGLGVGKDQIWVVGLFDKKKKSACEIRSLKWSICKMKKGIENNFKDRENTVSLLGKEYSSPWMRAVLLSSFDG